MNPHKRFFLTIENTQSSYIYRVEEWEDGKKEKKLTFMCMRKVQTMEEVLLSKFNSVQGLTYFTIPNILICSLKFL